MLRARHSQFLSALILSSILICGGFVLRFGFSRLSDSRIVTRNLQRPRNVVSSSPTGLWSSSRNLKRDHERRLSSSNAGSDLCVATGSCAGLEWSMGGTPRATLQACNTSTASSSRNNSASRSNAHHPVTLVTGYYHMKSKHSVDSYMSWVRLFLLRLTTPTVVYTSCNTARKVPQVRAILSERRAKMPGRTHVRFLDLEETNLALKFGPVFKTQEARDPERAVGHNYWLYLVWLMKTEALMDATRLNVYFSEWFVWSDIGALRHEAHRYSNWPLPRRLTEAVPRDRVMMGLISGFGGGTDERKLANMTSNATTWLRAARHHLIDADHIIGTFIVFSTARNVHHEFYAKLHDTYKRMIAVDHLVVKDQTVYNAMFLLHPRLFALVPSRGVGGDDNWRYLQHWLADAGERTHKDGLSVPILK